MELLGSLQFRSSLYSPTVYPREMGYTYMQHLAEVDQAGGVSHQRFGMFL